ncbi:hypothetical protein HN51_059308 [Arachis hypogaea]|uniref:uncharacterized protein LOC107621636 isoform X2 n=1 Tax=Arachis ipaensis TaxID=130454 RepID=UPI0007AEF813|nr:uncharacterized protein LOC107621636 isoform X2 [Arachis ipaensis]QHN82710.1 hypothetical protein DS421_20g698160 [Arachis hypogaea]
MFGLGMVEGCGIPWLIWIQFLVSFLLLFVLFCFTLDHTDDDEDGGATAAPATASTSTTRFHVHDINQIQNDKQVAEDDETSTVVVTSNLRHTQGGENLDIKDDSVSCSSLKSEEENTDDNEDSSSPELFLHPCQYFQLATVAFLKCFGLDSTLDPSSTCRRRKRKES